MRVTNRRPSELVASLPTEIFKKALFRVELLFAFHRPCIVLVHRFAHYCCFYYYYHSDLLCDDKEVIIHSVVKREYFTTFIVTNKAQPYNFYPDPFGYDRQLQYFTLNNSKRFYSSQKPLSQRVKTS